MVFGQLCHDNSYKLITKIMGKNAQSETMLSNETGLMLPLPLTMFPSSCLARAKGGGGHYKSK